jgi:hypothetical protein
MKNKRGMKFTQPEAQIRLLRYPQTPEEVLLSHRVTSDSQLEMV